MTAFERKTVLVLAELLRWVADIIQRLANPTKH